ncbi:acyl-CoA thioesterase [Amycolatopsis cihanbeyliensis]|uniref:Acyl-CoA thioester hydrolase n=1 Tax=Amycolatopsis cihanbeyliensis TaxID=1128664 RepID=A0A542DPJ6_AMYCI|nr:acyl-CoA thioesterase [Amycolatopsis cihanbeyliensis]TQJ04987.1 acyl-CoA thioester hydrolase [Amycolatopsis cihanbeyliensis]
MTEREPFRVQLKVRHYELDTLGHVNHAVYHSYAEVARLELIERAGGLKGGLRDANLAAVLLESHISFRKELRAGEVIDVTCETKFGSGKTFVMNSNIYQADGTLAAEISCTLGLMDLERRKLVPDPRGKCDQAGMDLELLGGATA